MTAGGPHGSDLVLGIESSCDETAAAVVGGGRRILASIVASQEALHAPFRGVVPEVASRAHAERITEVIARALESAGTAPAALAAVAVTARPGLVGSLLVGVAAAKAFAWVHRLPLIDVDHIEGHVYSPCLEHDFEPPYVALVASGGHTALYRARGHGDYRLLGATRDDAAGEAFDKVAALLGLGYPGGPRVEALAREGDPRRHDLPRARLEQGSLDFSFSGLKTAVLYAVRGQDARAPTGARPADLAAAFQEALVDVLVAKLEAAALREGVSRVAVAGGVAANRALRGRVEEMAARRGFEVAIPATRLCTDNAAMIAGLGWHLFAAGRRAGPELEPSSRSYASATA